MTHTHEQRYSSSAAGMEVPILQVALHEQVGGCQNFWRAKPEYVQRYDLAAVIPQDVQEVLAVARARQRPKRGGASMNSCPWSNACSLALHIQSKMSFFINNFSFSTI